MNLSELCAILGEFAGGSLSLADVQRRLDPLLASDSLDIEASDPARWDLGADEERLFWWLVYLIESESDDGDGPRRRMGRIVHCLDTTRSAADTYELLPLVFDQDRLQTIVAKHRAGIISRTGFLSVLAESRYPPHAKLWLEHADPGALTRLAELLAQGEYEVVARMLERPPSQ